MEVEVVKKFVLTLDLDVMRAFIEVGNWAHIMTPHVKRTQFCVDTAEFQSQVNKFWEKIPAELKESLRNK